MGPRRLEVSEHLHQKGRLQSPFQLLLMPERGRGGQGWRSFLAVPGGSSLLYGLFSGCSQWRLLSLPCSGFSLRWLSLFQGMGSEARTLQ